MAYGLPASAWLEKGLPSAPTSVNGPPKLVFTGPLNASGASVCSRGMKNSAAVPPIASATMSQSSRRTCFNRDFGGRDSVTSDHHAQIGAAFWRLERAYRPSVRQRNLPCERQADAAAAFVGGVEGEEDVFAPIVGYAAPVVADFQPEVAIGFAGESEDDDRFVAVGRCPHRVAQQVEQRLGEQLGIGIEVHGPGFDLDPRVDLAVRGVGKGETHDLLGPRPGLELPAVNVGRLREF